MIIEIPNSNSIEINTIILDLNGTLSINGIISAETKSLIKQLKKFNYKIVLISGDIRGNAQNIATELEIDLLLGKTSEEKAVQMQNFDKNTTASIGNARIDIGTFKNSKLSIATLQAEGIHTQILKYVDIIVPSIENALQLFLNTKSLSGTLRK
jgi:soluble P-type ATPase